MTAAVPPAEGLPGRLTGPVGKGMIASLRPYWPVPAVRKVAVMLTPSQVAEAFFLESRHQLLEIAAYLDRYDAAVARTGASDGPARTAGDGRVAVIRRALEIVAAAPAGTERTVKLLELFATVP